MNILKRINIKSFIIALFLVVATLVYSGHAYAVDVPPATDCIVNGGGHTDGNFYTSDGKPCIKVDQGVNGLNFRIPSLSDILTFAIRAFFIIAGLAALLFLLLGALAWVTSGGDKENVSKAQGKITNAIIGVILIAVVLAVIVTLEQVVFAQRICLGLSCPITIPSIIKP